MTEAWEALRVELTAGAPEPTWTGAVLSRHRPAIEAEAHHPRRGEPMTDQTPATEAGRRHVDRCRIFLGDEALDDVLAIEAEARAAVDIANLRYARDFGYEEGVADERERLAGAVRALQSRPFAVPSVIAPVWPETVVWTYLIDLAAVLALLQPDTANESCSRISDHERGIPHGCNGLARKE